MMTFSKFPFYKQLDAMDCGPACLRMIAAYYGRQYSLQALRELSDISREGVSLEGIIEAAEHLGFRTMPISVPYSTENADVPSLKDAPLPCIVHWNKNHFIIVFRIKGEKIWVADPAEGVFQITATAFQRRWLSGDNKGVALLLQPTPQFFDHEAAPANKIGFGFLLRYLLPFRKLLFQLVIGLMIGSSLQLIFPFLTQAIVDIGIANRQIGIVYLILMGQLALFLGQTSVNIIQRWIQLHVGTRMSVAFIADFLSKLMKLPIRFFDTKLTGDLFQRIKDHSRIEYLLNNGLLTVVFSVFNLLVIGTVLFFYSIPIFIFFITGASLMLIWILVFMSKRRQLDYITFQELSQNHNALLEIIQGMPEIKLQNSERKRRQRWISIQANLFRANLKSLKISQYQDIGAGFINQLKDIIITVVAAQSVIRGEMTLGMMLAVQSLAGQLNAPLQQIIFFLRSAQDAKISLERLGEIHTMEDEEQASQDKITEVDSRAAIVIKDVVFRYNRLNNDVLSNINLTIPAGKITAIVGCSGSGKTTLVKLLLGFYQPTEGQILIGNTPLDEIFVKSWRKSCGAVLQDGYIFSDTIANNIAECDEQVNFLKLQHALEMANIQSFTDGLALGINTQIGASGNGISQGQRQRLLIARAVYKNPHFLFFDEATNALDANNERVIMENMERFFQGRTVVVVAHRLSTVKHADQIVVLDEGKIVEIGTHRELVQKQGYYFDLVKNQLELGV